MQAQPVRTRRHIRLKTLTCIKPEGRDSWQIAAMKTELPAVATPLSPPDSTSAARREFPNHGRLATEWKTVDAMIRLYCRQQHGGHTPCAECQNLLDYAHTRLERCQFGEDKPTCAKCPVHCYGRHQREQIRDVMRYAGPRMLWHHPLLSLRHWIVSLLK
jgi:hypothetical protein